MILDDRGFSLTPQINPFNPSSILLWFFNIYDVKYTLLFLEAIGLITFLRENEREIDDPHILNHVLVFRSMRHATHLDETVDFRSKWWPEGKEEEAFHILNVHNFLVTFKNVRSATNIPSQRPNYLHIHFSHRSRVRHSWFNILNVPRNHVQFAICNKTPT